MRDRPTLIQATYTIEIENVKIIEQALASDISNAEFSMAELNRKDDYVSIMKPWKRLKQKPRRDLSVYFLNFTG